MMAKMSIKAVWAAMAARVAVSAARSTEATMVEAFRREEEACPPSLPLARSTSQYRILFRSVLKAVKRMNEGRLPAAVAVVVVMMAVVWVAVVVASQRGREAMVVFVCQQWRWATRPCQKQRCHWHPLSDAAAVVKGAEKQQKTATSWQLSE
jgi:hypothetical protein